MSAIDISNLEVIYSSGRKALKNVNIHIDEGEFAFVMGRSGSGKSTLLKILMKELEPTEGFVAVGGVDLSGIRRGAVPKYRRSIGIIYQDFRLLKGLTVYENVAFAQRVIGVSPSKIKENVPEALRLVGLSAKYKSYPSELSGGEQQRVAIARAIVNRPSIILADEPTGNLDGTTALDIMHLLDEINKEGTTVVVITHSTELVEKFDKRVIMIDKGMVASDVGQDVALQDEESPFEDEEIEV